MNADKFLGRTDLPASFFRYQVDGILAAAASTPSVQGALLGGNNSAIRVNESAGHAVLPGKDGNGSPALAERVATADVVLVNEANWITLLYDRKITRVAYRRHDTGAIAYVNVFGAEAAHGSAVAATPAAIQAAVGDGNPWISLYVVTVYRSADAVVALAYDNAERPFGVPRSDGLMRTSSL